MPEILRGSLIFLLMASIVPPAGAKPFNIRDVRVAPAFFNPSLQQVATLSFALTSAGETTVVVVDRDGAPVRMLLKRSRLAEGRHSVAWNGRTDDGEIVPDEAWSFRIDVRDGKRSATYFPAADNMAANMVDVRPDAWDAVSGILRYTLPFPARVHVQAGSATIDPKTKAVSGPVMKTIVNREPRVAGAVIEQWDGFDESRTIRVADLPHFVMAIAATPLPASSVMTVGNRRRTFVSMLSDRRGASLLPAYGGSHVHHQGLTAVQDVSPPLKLEIENAKRSADGKKWLSTGSTLEVSATAAGPTAPAFLAEHGGIQAFIDSKRVQAIPLVTTNPVKVVIPIAALAPGDHILAVNWGSPFGPVAVNSLRFTTAEKVTP